MKTQAIGWLILASLTTLHGGCDSEADVAPVDDDIVAREVASPQAAAMADEPRLFVTELMSFGGPVGWRVVGNIDPRMVRAFLDPDSPRDAPSAQITVRRTRADQPDLDALAQAVADEWGGEVLEEAIELDGSPARIIEAAHPGEGLRPVRGLITRFFIEQIVIEAAVTPDYDGDIEARMTEVLDSWTWMRAGGVN